MASGILKVYDLGALGVNVDSDPIMLDDKELRLAQNAIRDPLGADSGLKKRPGLGAWSTTAASSAILGGIGVPLQDLTSHGLHIFFIGRGTT
jgi:hypothetical protein